MPTLPPAPRGNRGPVRVPQSSLRSEPQPDDFAEMSMLRSATRTRGSSGDRQVELYEAIGKSPHLRLGQLAANRRDQDGRTRRSKIVSWFDNSAPDGRYLNHSERGSTGEPVHVLTPADPAVISRHVDALIAQVR